MRRLTPLFAIFALAGCDQIDSWLHPYDETASLQSIPAPPAGDIAPYPGEDRVTLESRSGPCSPDSCFVFTKGRWKPLKDASGVPLLTIDAATGSAYGDDLWRSVGADRKILVNSGAAAQNLAKGQFDGLRIGLRTQGRMRYVTVFNLDKGAQSHVYAANETAWLLQTRPGGGANLADLFALPETPPIICLPGMAIDQNGWAGPPEKALSPDIFVSRAVDPAAAADEKAAVAAACAAKPKGTP